VPKRKKLAVAATVAALFQPLTAHSHSRQVTATVYHQWYHGRPDACGGTYSDYRVSAAHPWLPCGTRVRLTHKGKTLVVPVQDRCDCSSIDLSYEAARRLGVPTDGIATVTLQEL
jgi:rare lipoprotein A